MSFWKKLFPTPEIQNVIINSCGRWCTSWKNSKCTLFEPNRRVPVVGFPSWCPVYSSKYGVGLLYFKLCYLLRYICTYRPNKEQPMFKCPYFEITYKKGKEKAWYNGIPICSHPKWKQELGAPFQYLPHDRDSNNHWDQLKMYRPIWCPITKEEIEKYIQTND